MPEHFLSPVPPTAAARDTGDSRSAAPTHDTPGSGEFRSAAAFRGTAAARMTAASRGTGAAPCAWPAAPTVPAPATMQAPAWLNGPLAMAGRSRAFIQCPGSQIAAIARAQAMAAMGPADTLLDPAPLRVADKPEPAAELPPADHRAPKRHCMGTFRGQREQAGQARAFLAAFLGGWARVDDAVLLIGELSANAVVHTGSGAPGGLFTVRATLAGAWLRAEVEDQGSSWNGRLEEAECPHGLFLLRQLATRCGTRRTRGGWVTWFVLGDDAVTPAPEAQSGRSGINAVHSPTDDDR